MPRGTDLSKTLSKAWGLSIWGGGVYIFFWGGGVAACSFSLVIQFGVVLAAWNIHVLNPMWNCTVAHASANVSNVKKQTTITAFKGATFAVVSKLCRGFFRVPFT